VADTPLNETIKNAVTNIVTGDGTTHAPHNEQLYRKEAPSAMQASDTGTVAMALSKEPSLHLYCALVDKLKTGVDGADGLPTFFIDSAGGQTIASKKGGFQQLYQAINVPMEQQVKAEQDRCIFAMKNNAFTQLFGTSAKTIVSEASEQVKEMYNKGNEKVSVSLAVVHILFNWNAHSFFTYHQDTDGQVTVIINLSLGESSMHVAGYKEATYTGVGSAHMFPSNAFHRSGSAPRRCVKVALFFNVQEPHDLEADDDPSSSTTQPVVKSEVKPEVKPDAST
jgi:hypothetical protein